MPVDMTAAKAPPRKTTTPRKSASPTAEQARSSVVAAREEGLAMLATVGQALLSMTRQYADAAAIGMHAAPVIHETAKLSERYEWLGSICDSLIMASPVTALITAALPLGLQLAANHGLVQPGIMAGMNVFPPDVLEAKMKADIARAQAEAMREQREAMEEAETMRQEAEKILAGV